MPTYTQTTRDPKCRIMDSTLLDRVSPYEGLGLFLQPIDTTYSFQLLDPLVLASFVRYLCVFFVLELVRRVVQSRTNAFDDLRLVAASVAAFFVLLWPVAFSEENAYSLPLASLAMVVTAYIAFMESPWGLVMRRNEVMWKEGIEKSHVCRHINKGWR